MEENRVKRWKPAIAAELILCLIAITAVGIKKSETNERYGMESEQAAEEALSEGTIRWVDFTVTENALEKAYEWDVATYGQDVHIDWVDLLAYLAARYGGDFKGHASSLEKDMGSYVKAIQDGKTIGELTADLPHYAYYREAYEAVLGGMVGEYRAENQDGSGTFLEVYGLKAYLPVARNFPYNHYDDFGASRSYGYQRPHLGHDMMGQVGTPIVAIESGYIEALGWNQYGGWRIGLRSFDGRRYYYYAHLRQNYPYAEGLKEGSVVTAGDVIGYMGHTGYSTQENVNNIEVTHLHWGMELIFEEEQKDSDNEIWIDVYPLTQFLYRHRSEVAKVEGTREWKRVWQMIDPAVEAYERENPTEESVSGNGTER